jgi:hypothetical protein
MHVTEPELEDLKHRIGELVCERQELRRAGASRRSLEWNRVQLARRQADLGRALIEQRRAATVAMTGSA